LTKEFCEHGGVHYIRDFQSGDLQSLSRVFKFENFCHTPGQENC
jgi:hypothetical protein